MTLEDYLVGGADIAIEHDVIIDGLRIECNNLFCGYTEYFPTVDDATVAAEIHKESNG